MIRLLVTFVLLGITLPAQAQGRYSLEKLNRKLAGYIVDQTHNHGCENRIFSKILCQYRDLYIYLPPGYNPSNSYSLVLWLHGAFGDEHGFLTTGGITELDAMINQGNCPPVIVACPDGTLDGRNRLTSPHSFYINGRSGRYEDYLTQEVIPFLEKHFSIRPERQAHGLGGPSAGGFGALSLAIKRRDYFSAVAVVAAPVNMRYYNCQEKYFKDFEPMAYEWRSHYDPKEVVAKFGFGVVKFRARLLLETVFGPPEMMLDNIIKENPADLIQDMELGPGELSIFLHYPSHDNFNFDAHNESFAWLASEHGIEVHLEKDPFSQHLLPYFRRNQPKAHHWLCNHLLPPTAKIPEESSTK